MITSHIKKKISILDMGAGANPHPRSTHAVDGGSKSKLTNKEIQQYKKRPIEI